MQHVRHGNRVGKTTLGLVEDGTRQAGVGGRFWQVRGLLWTVVVVAAHGVILRHGRLVWEVVGLVESLGNILRDPELVDVLIVSRQVLGRDGHLFLAFHVSIWHAHAVGRCQVRHLERTAQWSRRSATFHRETVVLASFVPTGGCQIVLAVKTGGSWSRRFQRREARSH